MEDEVEFRTQAIWITIFVVLCVYLVTLSEDSNPSHWIHT